MRRFGIEQLKELGSRVAVRCAWWVKGTYLFHLNRNMAYIKRLNGSHAACKVREPGDTQFPEPRMHAAKSENSTSRVATHHSAIPRLILGFALFNICGQRWESF
jgi:hypothetical protein